MTGHKHDEMFCRRRLGHHHLHIFTSRWRRERHLMESRRGVTQRTGCLNRFCCWGSHHHLVASGTLCLESCWYSVFQDPSLFRWSVYQGRVVFFTLLWWLCISEHLLHFYFPPAARLNGLWFTWGGRAEWGGWGPFGLKGKVNTTFMCALCAQ